MLSSLCSLPMAPANAPMAMHWIFTLVEAATRLVRPAMVAGACVYVWTRPSEIIAGLQSEILTFSFAWGYFWLGTRLRGSWQRSRCNRSALLVLSTQGDFRRSLVLCSSGR